MLVWYALCFPMVLLTPEISKLSYNLILLRLLLSKCKDVKDVFLLKSILLILLSLNSKYDNFMFLLKSILLRLL